MAPPDPGSARDEAERLVAVALAAARRYTGSSNLGPFGDVLAGAFGHAGGPASRSEGTGAGPPGSSEAGSPSPRIATGSPECCVCPICRTIAALREPDPAFAERLATGAGDLAAGVASLMRAFSSGAAAPEPPPVARHAPAGHVGPSVDAGPAAGAGPSADTDAEAPAGDADDVWRSATRTGDGVGRPADRDVWSAATGARPVKPMARKAVKRAVPPEPRQGDDA
jgi:hypothetical protein